MSSTRHGRMLVAMTIMLMRIVNRSPSQAQPLPYPLPPTADLRVQDLLPLEAVERIADAHAFRVWGEDVRHGEPFPLSAESGKVFSYVFPYVRGTGHFPQYEEIFAVVRRLRAKHLHCPEHEDWRAVGSLPAEFYVELEERLGRFGSVQVSATRTNFPILSVSHSLHPYFLFAQAGQQEAERFLSEDGVFLERFYFLGPHEECFEFASADHRVLLHAYSLKKHPKEEVLRPRPERPIPQDVLGRRERAWREVEPAAPYPISADDVARTHTVERIPYWNLVPVVDQTYWCNPTAVLMIAGFWDNYAKGTGTITGYGRIIDYWLEHPSGSNVSNTIDEFIDPATSTWSSAAFEGTLNTINKYDFTWQQFTRTSNNDWGWMVLKQELDNGKPSVYEGV